MGNNTSSEDQTSSSQSIQVHKPLRQTQYNHDGTRTGPKYYPDINLKGNTKKASVPSALFEFMLTYLFCLSVEVTGKTVGIDLGTTNSLT